ncbi:DUF4268 domain-containing protein [Puteibacter caeruleilacunae]|nr:DUF4268 domain-containing protein [Puteibacter caeruleilacunae]
MYSKEEKKKLVRDFWNQFDEYSSQIPELMHKKKKWMLYNTKIAGVTFKFDVQRKYTAVILELSQRNEKRRLEMYEKLESYKAIIEEGFEDGLIWDFAFVRESGQEVCRVFTELEGPDFHRKSDWEAIFEFMATNMMRLENSFLDIRDILQQNK